MMKTIELVLSANNTTTDYYLPVKDRCRLVSAVAGDKDVLSAVIDVEVGASFSAGCGTYRLEGTFAASLYGKGFDPGLVHCVYPLAIGVKCQKADRPWDAEIAALGDLASGCLQL